MKRKLCLVQKILGKGLKIHGTSFTKYNTPQSVLSKDCLGKECLASAAAWEPSKETSLSTKPDTQHIKVDPFFR
jgi:hypothetical protein